MNQKKLEKLLKIWQKRLRIQDWDIKIKFARQTELGEVTGITADGSCNVASYSKEAWILILDPVDRVDSSDSIEHILVHELLHVAMPARELKLTFNYDLPEFVKYEEIVDSLSKVLMEAYNGQ